MIRDWIISITLGKAHSAKQDLGNSEGICECTLWSLGLLGTGTANKFPLADDSAFMAIPWLSLTPILFALLVTLIELRKDAKENRRVKKWRWVMPVLALCAAVSSGGILVSEHNEKLAAETEAATTRAQEEKRAEQLRQSQAEASLQLDEIGARLGIDRMTQNYLDSLRIIQEQYNTDKTKGAVEALFLRSGERKKVREGIKEINGQLYNAHILRTQPVLDLIINKLDGWQNALEARGVKVTAEKGVQKRAISIDKSDFFIARRYIFSPSNLQVDLRVTPALIEGGKWGSPLNVQGAWHRNNGIEFLFQITVRETGWTLENGKQTRLAFKSIAKDGAPTTDPAGISSINDALDEVMSMVTEEALPDLGVSK